MSYLSQNSSAPKVIFITYIEKVYLFIFISKKPNLIKKKRKMPLDLPQDHQPASKSITRLDITQDIPKLLEKVYSRVTWRLKKSANHICTIILSQVTIEVP